ncbi:MAG: phosphatase PAP2 family protein [bacterium]
MRTSTRPTIERCRRALVSAGAILAVLTPHVVASQQPTDPRDTTHSQKQAPFFTFGDMVLAGVFAGATIIATPLDRHAAIQLADSSRQANHFLKRTSTGVEYIASPGAYIIGASLYTIGKVGGYDRLADLGWHGTEAVLFAEGVTFFLKGVVGRGRPFLSAGHDPDDFHVGKGFSSGDWSSFPSGHTSTAFAAAAAVTNEAARWQPRSAWIIGPVMYVGATAVGLSRMYHSRHWGSDVAIGAAIGTFSGRKITQYAHGHPGNRLDRFILRTSLVPDGHGGMVAAYSIPVP